jgi:hypothetical protein
VTLQGRNLQEHFHPQDFRATRIGSIADRSGLRSHRCYGVTVFAGERWSREKIPCIDNSRHRSPGPPEPFGRGAEKYPIQTAVPRIYRTGNVRLAPAHYPDERAEKAWPNACDLCLSRH